MRPAGTFDESYGQDMAILRTRFQWIVLLLALVFLFGVFPLIADRYLMGVANLIGITIIAALGLQLMMGYCGLVSMGHMAFMAVGGYTTAILTYHLGWPWIATIPVSIIASAIVGTLFCLPALRIKGFYLVLATMGAHFIIMWIIYHGGDITGAQDGLPAPVPQFGGLVVESRNQFFYLIMIAMVVMTLLAKNLVRMKLGRALVAIRDNDIAAEFMGINVFGYKIIAFSVGAAFAGVAGSIYAAYLGSVMPEYYPFIESLWYMGYCIIGGLGSITGVYFGVIFLLVLRQLMMIAAPALESIVPIAGVDIFGPTMQIVFGLVVVLFLVFEPRGLYHRWETTKSSIRLWPFPY